MQEVGMQANTTRQFSAAGEPALQECFRRSNISRTSRLADRSIFILKR